jgi:hypothetical protein
MKLSLTSSPGMKRLTWRLCTLCTKDLCGPQTQSTFTIARS